MMGGGPGDSTVAVFRKQALRSFLMARRAGIRPADVGLTPRRRSRTSGLNREEVAAIAGLSPFWYERFETQREARPGVATLEAVSKALRLSDEERAYLKLLALDEEPAHFAPDPFQLAAVGEGGERTAFALFDSGYNLVRSNRLHDWIFGYDEAANGAAERNALYRMFADAKGRAMWGDAWSAIARRRVGKVRWASALTGTTPSIVEHLSAHAAFREVWERHAVAIPEIVHDFALDHPQAGAMQLRVYAPRVARGHFAGFYAPSNPETVEKVDRFLRDRASGRMKRR
jgi:transcriptional regulator with XRE-family HTH domain